MSSSQKNLSTPTIKRLSVGTGAARRARPKYLAFPLGGRSASNEAFAHLLRVALPMRVALYYIAPTPDYRKRRESCRDGANRREFEKTLAKGSRRG
jgi:hypothetical protein